MLTSAKYRGGRLLSLPAALFLLLVLFSHTVQAKYASLVMDAETGHVLYAVNADTRNYPASLTKMMTLYLLFEAIDTGKITLNQRFRASRHAAAQAPSKIGLTPGETMTVRQAILALVTKSANDVASMVAENLGGSERDFALMMTAKARQLGMSRTTFRNASGLPHRGHMSTARDMATLARRLLIDFPQYYHYFSTWKFDYDGVDYRNHNKLLKKYEGTDGIKTGYIRASGFNLVASAVRGGHRLIGVIFGGRSPRSRDRRMMALLDKGFAELNRTVVVAKAEPRKRPRRLAQRRRSRDAVGKAAVRVPAHKAKDSDKAKSPAPKTPWAIQVGAYSRFTQALKMAKRVISKFPSILKDGTARVVPLKVRRRHRVYRARIVGLEKHQAYVACRKLKHHNIDCMEVRLKNVQLAYAGD